MVLCNTSLRKTPQRHRKSRMQTSEMRTAPINKNKKVEKSCWQTEKAVIWYQSCSGRETTEKQLKNLDNWTVKQPWKLLKSFIFKELTFKNSKKGMNSQAVILTESNTFYQRVWSWLRMNAGGVLNTCKSNEGFWMRLRWIPKYRVADGWVTRGQPALYRGTTAGNGC